MPWRSPELSIVHLVSDCELIVKKRWRNFLLPRRKKKFLPSAKIFLFLFFFIAPFSLGLPGLQGLECRKIGLQRLISNIFHSQEKGFTN